MDIFVAIKCMKFWTLPLQFNFICLGMTFRVMAQSGPASNKRRTSRIRWELLNQPRSTRHHFWIKRTLWGRGCCFWWLHACHEFITRSIFIRSSFEHQKQEKKQHRDTILSVWRFVFSLSFRPITSEYLSWFLMSNASTSASTKIRYNLKVAS